MEKVSIIIPSYGGGQNLQRTIDSVLNQDYPCIECIVVDDNGFGTPTQIQTKKEMQKYEGDFRVKYICHEKNINGSAARNTGFKASTGAYISVLDDDDELLPDFVSILVETLENLSDDYSLAYVRAVNIIDGKEYTMEPFYSKDEVDPFLLFTRNYGIFACCYMMKRCNFEKVGGYDESFRRHQDMEFIEKAIVICGMKVKGIDKVCYRRYLMKRNNPANPDLALKYRKHYLENMKPYFRYLPEKVQISIYEYHMMDVAMLYLTHKDVWGFLKLYLKVMPGKEGNLVLFNKVFSRLKRINIRLL